MCLALVIKFRHHLLDDAGIFALLSLEGVHPLKDIDVIAMPLFVDSDLIQHQLITRLHPLNRRLCFCQFGFELLDTLLQCGESIVLCVATACECARA